MLYDFHCILEAPETAEPTLKTLEHHAEHLLDLDNWSEIQSVSNVTVKPHETRSISKERCIQLLNTVVDHAETARNTKEQIHDLLQIGFTEEELIQVFNFDENDIKDAAERE